MESALVTLDRDGMALVRADGRAEIVPTRPRQVYDITGAGDMVLAVVGLCLAGGADYDEAAALGNVAGRPGGREDRRRAALATGDPPRPARPPPPRGGASGSIARRWSPRSGAGGARGRRSSSPTAASTCSTSATSACSARPPALGDFLVVGLNCRRERPPPEGRRPARSTPRTPAPSCWRRWSASTP